MQAIIRYFTGTGNTARVMQIVSETLQAAGWTSDCQESWLAGPARETPSADLLVLGHSTLGTGAPVHFLNWLRQLPPAPGSPAAILSVCGASLGRKGILEGDSLYSSVQIGSILRRKGYRIICAQDISLPINWTQVLNPPAPEPSKRIFSSAEPQIRQIAAELSQLRGTIRQRSWLLCFLGATMALLYQNIGRRFLGKIYFSDNQCNGCGLCATSCPAQAIHLRKGRPAWNLDCSSCNRCINICPKQAIQTSAPIVILQLSLNLAALVAAIACAAWPGQALGLNDLGAALSRAGLPTFCASILIFASELVSFCVLFGLACIVQFGPLDALFQAIGHTKFGSRILSLSWTRHFRRYLAPGFSPSPGKSPQ